MIGEFVKIKVDHEIHKCEVLCFISWDSILNENKTTLMIRPHFLGYYNHSWPEWLTKLFENGVLTIDMDAEDRPILQFTDGNILYDVNERDLILRYKTVTGNVSYRYMNREEYDGCPKEEYHEVKF